MELTDLDERNGSYRSLLEVRPQASGLMCGTVVIGILSLWPNVSANNALELEYGK